MAVIESYLLELSDRVAMATEGLAQSEVHMRCAMDWAGVSDIPCVGSPEEDADKLTEGGMTVVRKVRISVRAAGLLEAGASGHPEKHHTIGYRNSVDSETITYRVMKVINHWNAWFELVCEDPHAGA